MNIPSRYNDLRQALPEEVNFGCGGIKLFSSPEIEGQQLGYSVAANGSSLCTGAEGAWQPSWLVIGCESALGDPIFIDTDDDALPVFTAMHGEGAWEPNPIATSAEAFANCLKEFARIAAGRANPGEHNANPVGDDDRKRFLNRIAELNRTASAPEFWDVMLEF